MDRQMERQRVTRAGVEQGPSTLAGVGGPEVGQGASGPAHTAPPLRMWHFTRTVCCCGLRPKIKARYHVLP